MVLPDDLPGVVEYLLHAGGETITARNWQTGQAHCHVTAERTQCAYPRRPVSYRGSSGITDAANVCPRIPYGSLGWRVLGEKVWRALKDIPKAWLPFLQRERETEWDPRVDPVKDEARKAAVKAARAKKLAEEEHGNHEAGDR